MDQPASRWRLRHHSSHRLGQRRRQAAHATCRKPTPTRASMLGSGTGTAAQSPWRKRSPISTLPSGYVKVLASPMKSAPGGTSKDKDKLRRIVGSSVRKGAGKMVGNVIAMIHCQASTRRVMIATLMAAASNSRSPGPRLSKNKLITSDESVVLQPPPVLAGGAAISSLPMTIGPVESDSRN